MANGDVYRAKVSRTGVDGVHVEIPMHFPGVEFGPLDLVASTVRLDLSPVVNGMADFVQAGDVVLVVDTGSADFLVVGTIRSGVSVDGGL